MQVEFRYELGDVVETRRGENGKIVSASVSEGRHEPLFLTYKIEKDDGTFSWASQHAITRVIGW